MEEKIMNYKVKELTLKDVIPNEVFAGMDALELLFDHAKTPWVRKFLEEHNIEVQG